MVLRHGTSYKDSKEILVTEDSEEIWEYIHDFQRGERDTLEVGSLMTI